MPDPYVLIVSTIADIATDEVVRRLCALGVSHKRLNTENFPFTSALVYRPDRESRGQWALADGEPMGTPTSIWYRRLRTPSKPDGMDEGIYTFCLQENRAALLGSLLGLTGRWMSHPTAVWQAEFKPFQLSTAVELDLNIPRTVITNDPSTIRRAYREFSQMIVKPVRSGHIVQNGQEYAVFTSQVLEQHLEDLEEAKWSPAIYQALVPKLFDLRVTIVGTKIFTVAIDSQSNPAATVDWRQTSDPNLPHYPFVLPKEIAEKLLRLMNSLRLSFAGIDMIQTVDGRYVFLEMNPSGQWLWLDDMLHLGISDAVAEWLAGAQV